MPGPAFILRIAGTRAQDGAPEHRGQRGKDTWKALPELTPIGMIGTSMEGILQSLRKSMAGPRRLEPADGSGSVASALTAASHGTVVWRIQKGTVRPRRLSSGA